MYLQCRRFASPHVSHFLPVTALFWNLLYFSTLISWTNRFNPYQWYVWLQRKGEYFNKSNFQCKMQENLPVLHSLYMCQRVYSFRSSAGESSAILFWPFTQNRWHLFLYEWTTTKGTIYVVSSVCPSPLVSVFFCQYVCLYIRVFVWFSFSWYIWLSLSFV